MPDSSPVGTEEQPALFGPPAISDPPAEDPAFFGDFQTPEALQAELDRLKGIEAQTAQDADRFRQLESRIDTLLSQPAQSAQAPPAPVVGPRPDAINEPEKFNEWLDQRDARLRFDMQQETRQSNTMQQEAQDRAALWSEFESEYPEYKGCEALAQSAFLEETRGTFQIPADRHRFKQSIKSRMDRMKQQLGVPSNGSDPSPPSAGGRATGVMGPSTARPAQTAGPVEEKTKSLVDAIQDQQMKSGFY